MTEEYYNKTYDSIAERIPHRKEPYEELLDLDTDYIHSLESRIKQLELSNEELQEHMESYGVKYIHCRDKVKEIKQYADLLEECSSMMWDRALTFEEMEIIYNNRGDKNED